MMSSIRNKTEVSNIVSFNCCQCKSVITKIRNNTKETIERWSTLKKYIKKHSLNLFGKEAGIGTVNFGCNMHKRPTSQLKIIREMQAGSY